MTGLSTQSQPHTTVLLAEAVAQLKVERGGRYVDCTVGPGGHAAAILEESAPGGRLLGIDADPAAVKLAAERLRPYGSDVILVNENFRYLERICERHHFRPVNGILFDLGLSSLQLDRTGRGFSFRYDAPLDMRFAPGRGLTAAQIVNTFPEPDLALLLRRYGEERRSQQIARAIVKSRPLNTTLELARVVAQAVGGARGRLHPATRTFQALRIAVNEELESLGQALSQAVGLLGSGGRLVAISYHSLEDRVVKELFQREARDCVCPPGLPSCVCGHRATLTIISKRVVRPSAAEIAANPRSRSARMRVAEHM